MKVSYNGVLLLVISNLKLVAKQQFSFVEAVALSVGKS
jgi:hypothetical protein